VVSKEGCHRKQIGLMYVREGMALDGVRLLQIKAKGTVTTYLPDGRSVVIYLLTIL
jgi:hypothetical protein